MIKKLAICDVCGKEIGEADGFSDKYYELKSEGFSIRIDMMNRYFNAMETPVHLCSAICLRTYANKIVEDITDRVKDVVDRAIQYTPMKCDKETEEVWETPKDEELEEGWDANILVSHGINGMDKLDTQTI